MKTLFRRFCENIKLTQIQRDDAKTKYRGVCKTLQKEYYPDSSYDGKTKLLFGSYRTKTNIRPISEDQDVDVLFKIPEETYEKFKKQTGNGPSALLQELRGILNKTYTTTKEVKAWGKIVLVKMSDGKHNVELLPAFEKDDKTFIIPNTEDGGSWDDFDPRKQVQEFRDSNEATDGLTGELCRMLKSWVKITTTLNYNSFELLNDVMSFLKVEFKDGDEHSEVVKNFFDYYKIRKQGDKVSHLETAYNRAVKAIELMEDGKRIEASRKWRKIFGNEFPVADSDPKKASMGRNISENRPSPWCKV